ncbi:MAG TPA: hypothetical protein VEL76_26835 [Gemmataceae bacterium]|nr:hypothetical protein [Gemmataceae bacterium]
MSNEQERHESFAGGPEPHGDSFAATAEAKPGCVEVIHGVYAHSLPLAGMTVEQARVELEDRMNIDPEALAVVDGVETGEDEILREGQVLNFVKQAGEKG